MKVIVAKPRGFCAGVERAIEIVERALEMYGSPIYVRHAIVHNKRVVEKLKAKGVVFVEELEEIKEKDARVIFSAHGVSPAVWTEAKQRSLQSVDAVCPLVTKVHSEVKHYADKGYSIVLIGHRNHVEVIGTSGEAPDKVIVVESVQEAESLHLPDPDKVAYVTQTTLSVDDTRDIVEKLKERFPKIVAPSKLDICYATQNRQDAVKQLAKHSDLIFIMGSPESSNSNRLVEVAKSCGVEKSYLIEGSENLDRDMFTEDMTVGLSSGASTPETVVQEVIIRLMEFGAQSVEELDGKEEFTRFPFEEHLEFRSSYN
ncbi:MAG: 4-hydroxy-3-methylbut-2-enyl diphosphate reductase [Candidatus Dadabacteria bacterium]|nr:4-hydroxy-3-methylbut-2-enyl diphosphate reductase [Candidatus Dadabacteria bacterium]NIS09529.1 4-hydroxy-3-methylbut-2-enyl diphosphate reductase [Candidatus Dadabacteria bacterium]NIV42741.1 4-hydroxy-3-methylbut-2-enyl diphosphate reductase [Candidatus Dadabacteria bacterium]NIX16635.1 4-hydroxy-3-methylbut-2-enyl diphosphate reductase [Candidatus Dadabacteria bacterium]NIY23176.1 4-hydroxy-3-methylbut-2-enyl diphosphate reductase [Candidatus Dadabacteria bacterium]